jgi:integrase
LANPYVVTKLNARGEKRYTGMYYDLKGKPRSAGTFSDNDEALAAAQAAQAAKALPSPLSPSEKQTITLGELWPRYSATAVSTGVVEPNTLADYSYIWELHIEPYFGRYTIVELRQDFIRHVLGQIREEAEVSTTRLQRIKAVLAVLLSFARELGIRPDNPAHGIVLKRSKRDQKRPIQVLSPEMWWRFHDALEEEVYQLFAELMVSSGARLCEMISFVEGDLDYETRDLAITKSTVEVVYRHAPKGNRYVTRPYTKNGDTRVVRLGPSIVQKIKAHVEKHGIKAGELWFPSRLFLGGQSQTYLTRLSPEEMAEASKSTFTGPNGRHYRHGTLNAYQRGKCRCQACRQINSDRAAERYRRQLAKQGKAPRQKKIRLGATDHLSLVRWGEIFRKARNKLGLTLTPYQLRHTHGSVMLRAGATLAEVQERLGHHSISSTTKYLTAVPGDDDKLPMLIEQEMGYVQPKTVAVADGVAGAADQAESMAALFAKLEELKGLIAAGGGALPQKVVDLDSHRQVVNVTDEAVA